MAITITTRKALNLGLPTAVAGGIAFMMLRAKKDWKFILIAAAIGFVVVWVIVSQVTKIAITQGPAPVPVGGGCDDYNAKALIDAIHEDTTCFFCTRDRSLYDTLLGLADCQLRTAYNYWNANYYGSTGKSLPIMIAQQGNTWDYLFEQQQKSLAGKFATLNLQ